MSDEQDEAIERGKLTSAIQNYLLDAYEARSNLLTKRRKEYEQLERDLKEEIEQLERKTNRVAENLKRSSVADLRAYHFLFFSREVP